MRVGDFDLLYPATIGTHHTSHKRLALALHDIRVDKVTTPKDAKERVVDSAVGLMPFDVFVPIFECSNSEDDQEGQYYEPRRYCGEFWKELKDCDTQEESENVINNDYFFI